MNNMRAMASGKTKFFPSLHIAVFTEVKCYVDDENTGIAYLRSEDGINWTDEYLLGETKNPDFITYLNGTFFFVYKDYFYISEDGVNWEKINIPDGTKIMAISTIKDFTGYAVFTKSPKPILFDNDFNIITK